MTILTRQLIVSSRLLVIALQLVCQCFSLVCDYCVVFIFYNLTTVFKRKLTIVTVISLKLCFVTVQLEVQPLSVSDILKPDSNKNTAQYFKQKVILTFQMVPLFWSMCGRLLCVYLTYSSQCKDCLVHPCISCISISFLSLFYCIPCKYDHDGFLKRIKKL